MAKPFVERLHRGASRRGTVAEGRRTRRADAPSLAAAALVLLAIALASPPARASDSSSDGSSSSDSGSGSPSSDGESARGESTEAPGAFEPRPPLFPKLSGSSSGGGQEKALRDVLDLVRKADPRFKDVVLGTTEGPPFSAIHPAIAPQILFNWYQANRGRAASTGKLSAADARALDRYWGERSARDAARNASNAAALSAAMPVLKGAEKAGHWAEIGLFALMVVHVAPVVAPTLAARAGALAARAGAAGRSAATNVIGEKLSEAIKSFVTAHLKNHPGLDLPKHLVDVYTAKQLYDTAKREAAVAAPGAAAVAVEAAKAATGVTAVEISMALGQYAAEMLGSASKADAGSTHSAGR